MSEEEKSSIFEKLDSSDPKKLFESGYKELKKLLLKYSSFSLSYIILRLFLALLISLSVIVGIIENTFSDVIRLFPKLAIALGIISGFFLILSLLSSGLKARLFSLDNKAKDFKIYLASELDRVKILYNLYKLKNDILSNKQYLQLAGFIQYRLTRFRKLEASLFLNFSEALAQVKRVELLEGAQEDILSKFDISEEDIKLIENEFKLLVSKETEAEFETLDDTNNLKE